MSTDLMKENGFTFKKSSRWYSAETIMDADYTDDLTFLINTSAQAESGQAVRGIGFSLYSCFKYLHFVYLVKT